MAKYIKEDKPPKKTEAEKIAEGTATLEWMERNALRGIFDLGTDKRIDEGMDFGLEGLLADLKALGDKEYGRKRIKCPKRKAQLLVELYAEARAKIMSFRAKTLDTMFRMRELARGNPDSRAEITEKNTLIELCTDEEITELMERAKKKEESVLH